MQVACDDGDPCTINDTQTVLSSDGNVPCAGDPAPAVRTVPAEMQLPATTATLYG